MPRNVSVKLPGCSTREDVAIRKVFTEAWRGGIHLSQEYQQAFTSYLGFIQTISAKPFGNTLECRWFETNLDI